MTEARVWSGFTGTPLEPDAEIVRIFLKITGPPEPKMHVKAQVATYIAFRNGLPVLDMLHAAADEIASIVDELAPSFATVKARRIWVPRQGRIRKRSPGPPRETVQYAVRDTPPPEWRGH